uniref:Non-lysosomal glucosylceramidase n=1 Tax=Cacopsylla melanoneura TaxID=428564 RepID=A0A8D8W696_9HEMI
MTYKKVLDVQDDSSSGIQGVHILDEMNDMKQAFTLSALTNDETEVSVCSFFDPKGPGREIWTPLSKLGYFENGGVESKVMESQVTQPGQGIGVGLSVRKYIAAGSGTGDSGTGDSGTGDLNRNEETIEMSLVWTMGVVQFRNRNQTHRRYYSKWFPGENVFSAELMSEYALTHYKEWNQAIDSWQKPTLEDEHLPSWYKSCIFNELYYISDGGTVWFRDEDETALDPEDPRKQFGRFAYLEGHEYRMYNTFDVHFYASFSLGTLWPRLEQCLMQEFRDSVYAVIDQERWLMHSGEWCQRKKPLSVPHDLGNPEEEPFELINAYNIYDVSDWKDLNLKFIISLYRDYTVSHDVGFLSRMFPCALDLIRKCDSFDKQGLGIVQNGGFPDQTFDCWTMTGVSAYCGGLHIAALACLVEMAALLGHEDEKQEFQTKLTKASQVYHDLLWTGSYYRFDSSHSKHSQSIMADQLCGYLFLKASGVNTQAIFPAAHIDKTLDTIFSTNVKGFHLGSMGAVNGMNPDGTLDRFAIQSEEVWTGVTYLLAATMLYEGRQDQAWVTAGGLYRTVYERIGLGFETPEGLTGDRTYRSGGYMRALAVYAMQQAYNKGNKSH